MEDRKINYYIKYNNSYIDERDPNERLDFLSNRINILENDIQEIKNKNLSMVVPNNKFRKNSHNSLVEKNKLKSKNIISMKHFIKNQNKYSFNENSSNKNFSTIKAKKAINMKKNVYKKNNRYNDSINEKKNILLNISSQLNRNIEKKRNEQNPKMNNINKDFSSINNINNSKTIRQMFFMNEQNRFNLELKKNNGNERKLLNSSNNNDVSELEYEFEIKLLKKKLKQLKNENKEKKEKLDKMKIINKSIEKILDKQNVLNNLILLFKNYIIYNNKSRINSLIKDKNNNNNISDDALIFVIMDLKYDYENYILQEEFFEGVNKLFNTEFHVINNKKESFNNINIIKSIDKLIDLKNTLNNDINKYKYSQKENIKIFYYFTSLLQYLNLHSFTSLEKFIKKIYMENIEENYQMKKLKKTLMKNTSSSRSKSQKEEKDLLYISGHELSKSKNKNKISNKDLKKIFKKKNSDSRVKQIKKHFVIPNARNNNNLNGKIINRTEQLNKYNENFIMKLNNNENGQNLFGKNFNNTINNSLSYYTLNNPHYNNRKAKRTKININNYYNNKKNYVRKKIINIKNKSSINNLFNFESEMNDIQYNDSFEANKTLNNKSSKNNVIKNIKNNSVIITNK